MDPSSVVEGRDLKTHSEIVPILLMGILFTLFERINPIRIVLFYLPLMLIPMALRFRELSREILRYRVGTLEYLVPAMIKDHGLMFIMFMVSGFVNSPLRPDRAIALTLYSLILTQVWLIIAQASTMKISWVTVFLFQVLEMLILMMASNFPASVQILVMLETGRSNFALALIAMGISILFLFSCRYHQRRDMVRAI